MQLLALAFAAGACAFPSLGWLELDKRVVDQHPFIPFSKLSPGSLPVRSPCPGHNTLANHGFINRNGRNITKAAIQQGFFDAFSFSFENTAGGAQSALNLCSNLTGTVCSHYHLDQLSAPHHIEHDASFSRDDFQMAFNQSADNHDFNATIFNRSLAIWSSINSTHIDMKSMNTARITRQAQAQQDDFPGWFLYANGTMGVEDAFIMFNMNDKAKNPNLHSPVARLDWASYWIASERLPTDIGWTKQSTMPVGKYIGSIASSVKNAGTYSLSTTPTSPAAGGATPTQAARLVKKAAAAANAAVAADNAATITGSAALASAKSAARASATRIAGPQPELPNPYLEAVSPEEWAVAGAAAKAYVAKAQAAYDETLNKLIGHVV